MNTMSPKYYLHISEMGKLGRPWYSDIPDSSWLNFCLGIATDWDDLPSSLLDLSVVGSELVSARTPALEVSVLDGLYLAA